MRLLSKVTPMILMYFEVGIGELFMESGCAGDDFRSLAAVPSNMASDLLGFSCMSFSRNHVAVSVKHCSKMAVSLSGWLPSLTYSVVSSAYL